MESDYRPGGAARNSCRSIARADIAAARAAIACRDPHADDLERRALGARGHRRIAEGGVPAGHRLVQAPRGAQQGVLAGRGRVRRLVTASAGDHGRALAQAARVRGVECEVLMPVDAAVSKVAAVERLGARVNLQGASVDDALAAARIRAQETGAALVHPFDDIDVMSGQGTLGAELLEDVPDLARVLVPVGGGGLAAESGSRCAARASRSSACRLPPARPMPTRWRVARRHARPARRRSRTGSRSSARRATLPLLRELLDDLQTVGEDEIAESMVFLAENAKLVVEGAGAVGVALLLGGRLPAAPGTTVAVVSGGNVDSGLLASLLRRRETEEGRRVRIFTRVPDQPGGLAELLGRVAHARANLVSLEHVREAVLLHVRETGVELTLETRGPEHTRAVVAELEQAGYTVTVE